MSRKVCTIGALVLVIGAGCSGPIVRHSVAQETTSTENETEFKKIIEDYVLRTKGWMKESYTIAFLSKENENLHFLVEYVWPEDHPIFPGDDGKSFVAVINPDTKHVEEELGLQ